MKKKPVIVFLDAGTIDYGGIDLKPLKTAGQYISYKHTVAGQVYSRIKDADVVITNKVVLNDEVLSRLNSLKLICVAATGYNNIDLKACEKHGVVVSNAAGYSTESVVEHTLMFLFCLSHRVLEHHESVVKKSWCKSKSFNLTLFPFSNIKGKTLGIVGYGHIGKRVASRAKLLGMKVLVAQIPGRKYGGTPERVSLKTLLQKSDFVSLHCPLTEMTLGLFNGPTLSFMKKTAYLVNLARGPIVHAPSLVKALKKGEIAGYATDVFDVEPPPRGHVFLQKSLKNKVFFTPHVAWTGLESRQRLVDDIGETIEAFLKGRMRNRVV